VSKTNPTTIRDLLAWGALQLAKTPSPQLDSRILLGFALSWTHSRLMANPDLSVPTTTRQKFSRLIKKRAERWPIAYLTGVKDFAGLEFIVSSKVLIPRPATESIVETAVKLAEETGAAHITEVGTGSGAIAITLAKKLPSVKIEAGDISPAVLLVAKQNVAKHKVGRQVKLVRSDLLKNLEAASIVVANLPYLPKKLKIEPELKHEPDMALFDGSTDGLGAYKKLFDQISLGIVVIELGAKQYLPMKKWLTKKFGQQIIVEPIYDLDEQTSGLVARLNQPLLDNADHFG
jgi:release factor glutamine methyltransferase